MCFQAIFHYLSLAQVVSDNVGTSYRKDVLINFWIHAAGTGCAAVFLCFRSFVAKEDAPGTSNRYQPRWRLRLSARLYGYSDKPQDHIWEILEPPIADPYTVSAVSLLH